jgi:hypothetical protein
MPTTYLSLPANTEVTFFKDKRQVLEEPKIIPPCELNLPQQQIFYTTKE